VNKTVIIAIAFVLAVLILVVYTTLGTKRYRVEVCITFHERPACRTAGAPTEAQALRAATENTCSQIASGVTDSMACESTTPDSVKWLSRK
jgi:hypothetical protein